MMTQANLDQPRRIGNGVDRPVGAELSSSALGNTNPLATSGSSFGLDSPVPRKKAAGDDRVTTLMKPSETQLKHSDFPPKYAYPFKLKKGQPRPDKPSGEIVLFGKIMEDWSFDDSEAARLLGFEPAFDMSAVYLGKRFSRTRDTNDRLRAVLRIAADLDALFRRSVAIRDWLDEPQSDLGGITPRSLLAEGSMENLLRVKYYVRYLSGR